MIGLVDIVATLATGILASMAIVGGTVLGICAIAGGGCWFWLRRRRSK